MFDCVHDNTGMIDRSKLRDINDVVIDATAPHDVRIKSFIDQIGNPYCYLDGGVIVSVSYAENDVSLQDRLRACIANI